MSEQLKIDAFDLWLWKRLLRVLWTARRSNQSILRELNLEYSLEGLMLKLQYSGHLLGKADSLEKTLMLVKIELWFWRRLFRVSWTARRSSQSLLKEINPEYSLEGLS